MLQDFSKDSPGEAFSKERRLSTQGGLGRGQVESPGRGSRVLEHRMTEEIRERSSGMNPDCCSKRFSMMFIDFIGFYGYNQKSIKYHPEPNRIVCCCSPRH